MKKFLCIIMVALVLLPGCGSMSQTAKGTAIGSGSGAVLGAIVGALISKDAKGAAIGAAVGTAVGAGTGAVIGDVMDRKAKELEAICAERYAEEKAWADANPEKAAQQADWFSGKAPKIDWSKVYWKTYKASEKKAKGYLFKPGDSALQEVTK